ncbi:MAG: hypothetical protein HYR96_00905 [Deltaproteobacteria bacterium]|nr:hypothetical protein [Deltaproteobacteria bacterium]MBI3296073.1 hypothetical protein [Deltaproteobacteria bacterium]
MKPLLTLIMITAAVVVTADNTITTLSTKTQAVLGTGYATDRQSFGAVACVTGTPVFAGASEASLNFDQSMSETQLADSLGVSAGGKFRYGVAEVSASAKFFNESQSTAYSTSAIYNATYKFKSEILSEPKLSTRGLELDTNYERWAQTCGNEYIYQRDLGAKIFFSIRVDFASQYDKSLFETHFSLTAPMVSVGADFQKISSRLSKRTSVTVRALQIGGKVEKLSTIFPSTEAADKNARLLFVQCASGEYKNCFSVLESALAYATDTKEGFPSQISPELGTSEVGGPAILSYQTVPYTAAGIYPKNYPHLKEAVEIDRAYIADRFEENFKRRVQLNYLLRGKAMRVSHHQRSALRETEVLVDNNIRKILEASKACYETPEDCPPAKRRLVTEGTALRTVDDKVFIIKPESFSQYCDLAQGAVPKPSLKFIVGKVIEEARKADIEAFTVGGHTTDACLVAEDVVSRMDRLDLSNATLTELDAIAAFTHLRYLNLSQNRIQASHLAALKGFYQLVELGLSCNAIATVAPLSELAALTHLDLSDNDIQDTDPLSKLVAIERLDLRNNEATIKCPFPEERRCLIGNYKTSNAFIPLRYSALDRIQHQATLLPSGEILLSGGDFTNPMVEVYHPKYGFNSISLRMNEPRVGHRATLLSDGRVLLTGGWGSDTAEVFDPKTRAFRPTNGHLGSKRAFHTSTLLKDGRVLITGGWTSRHQFFTGVDPSGSGEIYDPKTDRFAFAASALSSPRAEHTATLLANGSVLLAGGLTTAGGLFTAEIYIPESNQFIETGRMEAGRGAHTATLVNSGDVLIVGGWNSEMKGISTAEVYSTKQRTFRKTAGFLETGRAHHAAALLGNGKVLITGGFTEFVVPNASGACKSCLRTAEIFDPIAGIFTRISQHMSWTRGYHTATILENGFVFQYGGLGTGAANSADLFEFQP